MTKFILGGGYLWKAADGGKAFCEELVRGFNQPVKVLICLFARPEEEWKKVFAEDREFLGKNLHNTDLELRQASINDFSAQVKCADAIYFRGGETEWLKKGLQGHDWRKSLEGKTVAGSSAGANILGRYYSKLDSPGVGKGLELLPAKIITHFKSNYNSPNIDWDKTLEVLEDYKEKLPVLTLNEGEFKVIKP